MSKSKFPISGVYEHYKSTPKDRRYYQVLGVARHTETDELMVIYIPLYVVPEHKGPRYQLRPLGMFMEKVEHNGKTMPRFTYIGPEL